MDHIKRIKNLKNGIVHHLTQITETIISALENKNDIKVAAYYSIQMDCSLDIFHKKQTSIIIRRLNFKEKRLTINKSFTGFSEVTDVSRVETLLK